MVPTPTPRPQDLPDVAGVRATGKGWVWNGTAMEWTDVATQAELDAKTRRWMVGAVDVGPSSGSEVTLIDQLVPGGSLGASGALRCAFGGEFFNNNGAATSRAYVMRVYVGGVKVYDCAASNIGVSTLRRAHATEMFFANRGNQALNRLYGWSATGNAIAPTTGISSISNGGSGVATLGSPFASTRQTIDTSVDFNFKVTLQLTLSDPLVEMLIDGIVLEALNA